MAWVEDRGGAGQGDRMRSFVLLVSILAAVGCQGNDPDDQGVELRRGQLDRVARQWDGTVASLSKNTQELGDRLDKLRESAGAQDARIAALLKNVQELSDRLDRMQDSAEAARAAGSQMATAVVELADETTKTVNAARADDCSGICKAAIAGLQLAEARSIEDVAALRHQQGALQIRLAEVGSSIGLAKELARVNAELATKENVRSGFGLKQLRIMADPACRRRDSMAVCQEAVASTVQLLLAASAPASGRRENADFLFGRFADEADQAVAAAGEATRTVFSEIEHLQDNPIGGLDRARKDAAAAMAVRQRALGRLNEHVARLEYYFGAISAAESQDGPVSAGKVAALRAQLIALRQALVTASDLARHPRQPRGESRPRPGPL